MKHANQWILTAAGCAAVMGSLSLPINQVTADEATTVKSSGIRWSSKMQELYKTLADLLTDVSSTKRYFDPVNKTRIESEATHLSALGHDLAKMGGTPSDPDPTIQIVAGMLRRETKRAADELKRGNRAYARNILRSVPNYCIACHTRNSTGPQFDRLPFEPTSKSLSTEERGEFFAASRQFDRAQGEFLKMIQDPQPTNQNNWNWEKAVHNSLAIAIRVKNDPLQAQEIVDAVLKTPNAPSFMKEDAKAWKKSIAEWREEPAHQPMTEEGLYAETLRLMSKARDMQNYPMDRTADVYYLRASATVHDLLQAAPNGVHAEDALLLAGISYEVLSPLKVEDLHEIYYEACIRRAPHSPTSELCYRRLEADTVLDYTGSGGTDVPDEVHQRLSELRGLSQPTIEIKN